MSIKDIFTTPLDALLMHPDKDVQQACRELLVKILEYNLKKEREERLKEDQSHQLKLTGG